MSRLRPLVWAALGVAAAVALVFLYRANREELPGDDDDEEAPIIAPPRVEIEDGDPVVVLDSAERARAGLRLAALETVTRQPEDPVPAQVIDEPERTTIVRAPVAGRLASGRWPALGERVAEGAELGQVSDARPLVAARGGTVVEVGARPGELVEAGQLLLRIVDRREPVVRVPLPRAADGTPPGRIHLVAGPSGRIAARLLGPAFEADPATRRPVFLYRAERSWPGAQPGAAVTALMPRQSGPVSGVLVPESAAVQWDGLVWIYRALGDGRFGRVRVPTGRPVAGGWLAGEPLAAGDSVVMVGAEQLLSEEFRGRVSVGEETGE